MPNSLNPDQARRNVGPDLSPNCLQRLSADDNSSEELAVCNIKGRKEDKSIPVYPRKLKLIHHGDID